ncbi:MAG TPA: DUF5655 domain-containing protein [Nitrosopumilaceae archaeon]|nr:DUF5655 domain-containing protein [Nitrosopumilaceae archaeon]
MNLVSFGNKRNYDEFKKQIPIKVQPLFDSLREFCLSLGKNVVEDVRMHRIVFGKSLAFRWFVDIEPQDDGVIIKVQKNRKETPKIIHLKSEQDVTEIKEIISEAFELIR